MIVMMIHRDTIFLLYEVSNPWSCAISLKPNERGLSQRRGARRGRVDFSVYVLSQVSRLPWPACHRRIFHVTLKLEYQCGVTLALMWGICQMQLRCPVFPFRSCAENFTQRPTSQVHGVSFSALMGVMWNWAVLHVTHTATGMRHCHAGINILSGWRLGAGMLTTATATLRSLRSHNYATLRPYHNYCIYACSCSYYSYVRSYT